MNRTITTLLVLVWGVFGGTEWAPAQSSLPQFGHVFIVVEENHGYSEMVGDPSMPYLNSLISKYGLAIDYIADTHPSIDNYFMLTVGQFEASNDDDWSCTTTTGVVSDDNIARKLINAGKTWKVYAESLPATGYTGCDSGYYRKHHNPFAYLTDVANSSTQRNNMVDFTNNFANDLTNGTLPQYSFIVPNVNDSAHDGTLAQADYWLQTNIGPLVRSALFKKDGLLVILFDEDGNTTTPGCTMTQIQSGTWCGGQVAAVVVSPFLVSAGFKSSNGYHHENLLKLMAQGIGLTTFPGISATAANMSDFFGTPTPGVTLSPAALAFSSQPVGTTTTAQAVMIANTGSAALTMTSIAIGGANSGAFAQTNNCPLSPATLAVNANCSINVTFTPTLSGTSSSTVSITDNAAGSPQAASLTGTGVATTASLSPTSLTFPTQSVGTTSTAQSSTLSNTGTVGMIISSVVASANFGETNNCGSSLTAGAKCTINVTFAPTATGTLTGTVTVNNTASNSPQSITLNGTAVASTTPATSLSPTSLTFPSLTLGTTSAAQAVTLSNIGDATLNITGITSAAPFAQTNNCGTSLAAGSKCTINVNFTPTVMGTVNGTLSVSDNASGSPQTVSLSATGLAPAASLSPASFNFANQPVKTTSAAQPFTLSNTGNAPMTVASIAITGSNFADFAQSSTCPLSPSTLAAGMSCSINVTFTPTATGTRTTTLTVTDNATNSPQTTSLSGTALAATAVPTVVQVQNNITTDASVTYTLWSVNITTQPGDLLIAFCRESSNGTDNFTVTDSAGQTWTQTSSGYANESDTGPRSGMFYIANSAAVTSVTVHYRTSGGVIKPGIMVMEISGAATTGVLDGSVNGGTAADTTTSTSKSLTTTNANDILIFATDTSGNESGWTPGTGYAIPNNKLIIGASGSNARMAMQYAVVSSVQTNTTTATTYSSSNWNGNIFAAFK
jgi:phosphoesterase family protein/HYDIN/CFA65/VesB family protein/ASPM-SPD-2-Hydin domain-containing protein/centrosomal CEP192-like protein